MKLTKDEARILEAALEDFKYELVGGSNLTGLMEALEKLQGKLSEHAKDMRRVGRKSQDDWHDLLKRFSIKSNKL
jgi:hypothetical protein